MACADAGHLGQMSAPTSSVTSDYVRDDSGSLLAGIMSGTRSWYDANGQRTRLTYPDGT
jgi:hypothetical protein